MFKNLCSIIPPWRNRWRVRLLSLLHQPEGRQFGSANGNTTSYDIEGQIEQIIRRGAGIGQQPVWKGNQLAISDHTITGEPELPLDDSELERQAASTGPGPIGPVVRETIKAVAGDDDASTGAEEPLDSSPAPPPLLLLLPQQLIRSTTPTTPRAPRDPPPPQLPRLPRRQSVRRRPALRLHSAVLLAAPPVLHALLLGLALRAPVAVAALCGPGPGERARDVVARVRGAVSRLRDRDAVSEPVRAARRRGAVGGANSFAGFGNDDKHAGAGGAGNGVDDEDGDDDDSF
ncbi:hypothetical protein V2W45_1523392 [Cenococcum geophilum]